AAQREIFEKGAINKGIDGNLAMKIFDLVEKFAGYGFNKSHSAAYALVSYQTLWLKAHFPAEFMAAVMSSEMDNTDKIVGLYDECMNMGLTVVPPDINSGKHRFSVNEKGEIVYGLGAIKGVGEGPIDAILSARQQDGIFKDLFDLTARVDLKKINRRTFDALIMSGSLDKLGPHRAALMKNLEDALKASDQHSKMEALGQSDMFGVLTERPEEVQNAYANTPKWSEQTILDGERATLGLYLSGHPIGRFLKELAHYAPVRLNELQPTFRGQNATVAGIVVGYRVAVTKRGSRIGIATIEDRSGKLDITLFSEALETYGELIEKDSIIIATGSVQFDDFSGGLKMSAREIMTLDDARTRNARSLALAINQEQLDAKFVKDLTACIEPYKEGTLPLHFYYQSEQGRALLKGGVEWRVTPKEEMLVGLRTLLGEGAVELEFE
ncbi:MAG: DNA polymerase III subunit alpha, partial [Haemophilus paraphrohaemolyticus]|uniref:helix-hairpin-helix domain-containing protein n=4 Tax=Pasteurellaceae TaxID=712 RepID=UPI001EBC352E